MNDIIKSFRKIIILNFPSDMVEKPVISNLVRLYDINFSILEARITPRKEGFMTMEICGEEDKCRQGIAYLKERGIKISDPAQKIFRDKEICVNCGVCTAICPNGSLSMDKIKHTIVHDTERCSACGLCVRICPVHAMQLEVENGHW